MNININIGRLFVHQLKSQSFIRINSRTVNPSKVLTNGLNQKMEMSSYIHVFYDINKSIANSQVVETTKQNLISFHDICSISWSLEIAIITIGVRTLITFPLAINQHKILAKYESLAPEINSFAEKLKSVMKTEAYVHNYSPLKAKLLFTAKMKQEVKRLIIRDNCHPFKASLVLWFQFPFWIILSHTIRNISFMYPMVDDKALAIHKQLSNEGILWFTDLTQTDPYFVLPVIVGLVNLINVQIHANERLKKMKTKTRTHKIITNICRGVSLALIPIGLYMPSSVCFYWFISSSMALIQNLMFTNNKFKQLIGIDIGLKTIDKSMTDSIKT